MTVVTKSPTQTYVLDKGWLNPERAYASDDDYTLGAISQCRQGYKGYGFNIPAGATITKVEIGIEGYITSGGTGLYVSWNADATWQWLYAQHSMVDILEWIDATAETIWTAAKLSDANFRVHIRWQAGSGCYGLDCEVGLWEGGLKKVRKVKEGDLLTGWQDDGTFLPAMVTYVKIHPGKWKVLRIIAEGVVKERKGQFKDVLITPDNKLPMWGGRSKRADQFKIGDLIYGHVPLEMTAHKFVPQHMTPFKVVEIIPMEVDGVADIKTTAQYFLGLFF